MVVGCRSPRLSCRALYGFIHRSDEKSLDRSIRRPLRLVLTCEHADHRIPRAYASLFSGANDVVRSHRGWDPGALPLARLLARRLGEPVFVTRWSRLLVEANRSPTNPSIWSRYTKALPAPVRERILARYWRPHRQAVEAAVAEWLVRGERVVHVAVHSFTPELEGVVRNADVGLLFDSRRRHESAFARRWAARLRAHDPALRVRYNYPYLGLADGLATALRRRHPASSYLGFELEVNQARSTAPDWPRLGRVLAASLAEALDRP